MKHSLLLIKPVLLVCIAVIMCGCGGGSTGLNDNKGGATLSLTANPTTVNADGISFSTITAVLTDNTGKPALQGTQVDFTTNLGFFANNSTHFQTVTDANGTAVAILYAGTSTGTAQVQCSGGGLVTYVLLSFNTQGGATLKLSANPTSIKADSISFSAITAVLTDNTGSPPKQSTAVQFTTNLGTFSNGSTSFTTQTDATGTATAVLYAGTTPGDVKVQCSAGGLVAITFLKFVNATSGPTASITLSVSNASIIADGISSSVITATLKDANGLPVAIGTSASFATNLAVFSNNKNSYATTTVDEKGTATATLIAGFTPGTATVTCTSGSVSAIIKIEIRSF
ncbi:MAG: hypothetical protein NTU74_01215 [Deltaproteobacteria bacterium]|nr:hypothetical protein [Deltaproteobacteria bacterium]